MRELHEGEQGLQASDLSLGLELQAVDQRLVLALLSVLARIPPVNGLSAKIVTFKKTGHFINGPAKNRGRDSPIFSIRMKVDWFSISFLF